MIPHYEVFQVKLKLMEEQGNCCPLCGQQFKDPTDAVLDHDHTSGLIRSALHDYCNKHLGFLEVIAKTISVEEAANRSIEYLNYHRNNPSNIIHPRQTRLRNEHARKNKIVKIPRLKLTEDEKNRYKLALKEGAIPHPNPKKNTSREGSWARTAKKYQIPYDRLLAYVNGIRPLSELETA
jgi:hypothetical protein